MIKITEEALSRCSLCPICGVETEEGSLFCVTCTAKTDEKLFFEVEK